MTSKTKVPAIPKPGQSPAELERAANALKEAVEVGFGRRGDPLDRFATIRELKDSGVAKVSVDSKTGTASVTGSGTGSPAGSGDDLPVIDVPGTINGLPYNGDPDYGQNDYTPPPAPTGVAVKAIAYDKVMVVFDPPNYGNHAFAEIYVLLPGQGDSLDDVKRLSPGFVQSKPCSGTAGANPSPRIAGFCDGSTFIWQLPSSLVGDSPAIPPSCYFFVRFVSIAKVPGPFNTTSQGVPGQPMIDPVRVVEQLQHAVVESTPFKELNNMLNLSRTTNVVVRDQLWAVTMAQRRTSGGAPVITGVALGITRDPSGRETSDFIVQADRFSVCAVPTLPTPLTKITPIGEFDFTFGTIYPTAFLDFPAGTDPAFTPVVAGATFQVISGNRNPIPSPWFDVKFKVRQMLSSTRALVEPVNANFFPPMVIDNNTGAGLINVDGSRATLYGAGSADQQPVFIVDSANRRVGISGDLFVTGMVNATAAQFRELTATTAFIGALRAGVVGATTVIGESLLAAPFATMPANGTLDSGQVAAINNWVVEITRPMKGGVPNYPLRIYNPAKVAAEGINTGGEVFAFWSGNPSLPADDLDRAPQMRLNGDLRVGGSAWFNPREGGASAIGVKSSDGQSYALWVGPDTSFRRSTLTMENEGFLWVRGSRVSGESTVRAGINANLFLGKLPFAQPSLVAENLDGATITQTDGAGGLGIRASGEFAKVTSAGKITIRANSDGTKARVLVIASVNLARTVPRPPNDQKRFRLQLKLIGPTEVEVQRIEMDDYSPETYSATLMGVVSAAAGDYRAEISVTNYLDDGQGPMAILKGWTCFAQYVRGDGDLLQELQTA